MQSPVCAGLYRHLDALGCRPAEAPGGNGAVAAELLGLVKGDIGLRQSMRRTGNFGVKRRRPTLPPRSESSPTVGSARPVA